MRQGIVWKEIFWSSLEIMDFGKILCDRVYFWAIFYVTGYRVWRDLPHTPVTSLVKYPPPPEKSSASSLSCSRVEREVEITRRTIISLP